MAKIDIVTADLHTLSSKLKQTERYLQQAHQMVAAAQGGLSMQVSSRSAISSRMEQAKKKLSLQRAKVGKMSAYSMQAAEEFTDTDRRNGRNLSDLFDNLNRMMGRMAGSVKHFNQSVTVQRYRSVAGIFLAAGSVLTVSGISGPGHSSGGGRHDGGSGGGRHDGGSGAAAGGVIGAGTQTTENASGRQTVSGAGSGRHDGGSGAAAGGVLGALAAGGVIGAGTQTTENVSAGQTTGNTSIGQTGNTAGGYGTTAQQPTASTNTEQSGQSSGGNAFGGKLVSFDASAYKNKTNGTYKDYFVVPGMKPEFVIRQGSSDYSKFPNFDSKGCTCCTYWTIASAWQGSAKGKPTDSYLKSQLAAGSSTELNPANIWEEAKKYTSKVQYLESICRNLEAGIPIGVRVNSDSGGHTISCVGLKKGTDIAALKQKVAALGKAPDQKAYDALLKDFQNNILVSDSGSGKITTLDNFSILMEKSLWYPKGAPVIKK